MTSFNTISQWFDEGKSDGFEYMIVWSDSFDYTNYPRYYDSVEEAKWAEGNPEPMTRVMESYHLSGDKDMQMSLPRSHALRGV